MDAENIHCSMDLKKLIRLVYQRRGLWDRQHPSNRSLYEQGVLWEQVARELNSTSEEVKTKWQTLRHSFRKNLRRMQVRECGADDLKFVDYKSLLRFTFFYTLKSRYTSSATNGHIHAKENKTSSAVPTDTSEGNLLSSQHCFKGPYHEREQITLNVSRADIPPTEMNNLRDDQREPGDRKPQTSHHTFQGPGMKKRLHRIGMQQTFGS
jgi:hypothetical protein